MPRRNSNLTKTTEPPESKLKLFQAKSEALSRHDFVTTGAIKTKFGMKMARGVETTAWHSEPNEHLLKSFLLDLRLFANNDEPLNMNHIRNLIARFGSGERISEELSIADDDWRHEQQGGGEEIVIFGRPLLPEYVWDLYINGFYFHTDPIKIREVEALSPLTKELYRSRFISSLPGRYQRIRNLGIVIQHGFEDDAFSFTEEGCCDSSASVQNS